MVGITRSKVVIFPLPQSHSSKVQIAALDLKVTKMLQELEDHAAAWMEKSAKGCQSIGVFRDFFLFANKYVYKL